MTENINPFDMLAPHDEAELDVGKMNSKRNKRQYHEMTDISSSHIFLKEGICLSKFLLMLQ